MIPTTTSARGTDPASAVTTRDSLGELYALHAPGALRLAYLLAGDRERAEDLVHDAFVRIVARFTHRAHPDDFGAYLRRAVVNLAASGGRRRRLENAFLQHEARRPAPGSSFPDVEENDRVMTALAALPYAQRLVVVLRIYQDLPEKDVGKLLRLSPAAVRSSLHRAVTTLRTSLKEEDDE